MRRRGERVFYTCINRGRASGLLLVTLSEEFDVPRTCNSATDCSMRAGHWLTKPQDRVAPVRLVRLIRTLSSDS